MVYFACLLCHCAKYLTTSWVGAKFQLGVVKRVSPELCPKLYIPSRDLYFDIKPTPGSWHCFWFLLKMVKFWPRFANTFPMCGNFSKFFKIQTKNWTDEVLALDSAKSYLRKEVKIGRTTTRDLNMSAALATFQKKSEKSHIFQYHFGNAAPNMD